MEQKTGSLPYAGELEVDGDSSSETPLRQGAYSKENRKATLPFTTYEEDIDVVDCDSIPCYKNFGMDSMHSGSHPSENRDSGFSDCSRLSSASCSSKQSDSERLSSNNYKLSRKSSINKEEDISAPIAKQFRNISITKKRPPTTLTKERVEEEISLITKLFCQNLDGDTLLHLAIINEKLELSHKIIHKTINYSLLNIQNNLLQTPIMLAVLTNQPTLVRELLVHGCSLTLRDRIGNMAIHYASENGLMECLKQLTNPVTDDEFLSAKLEIPYPHCPQDLSQQNYNGETCLHLAIKKGHRKIVEYLLAVSAQPNNFVDLQEGCAGRGLLHYAVERGFIDIAKLLLDNQANVNLPTFAGITPLNVAQDYIQSDIVTLLLSKGGESFDYDAHIHQDHEMDEEDD